MSDNAARVSKSRKKSGVKTTSISLSPDEQELLEALAPDHGGKKGALIAGLRRLAGANDLTKQDVVNWIERHVK